MERQKENYWSVFEIVANNITQHILEKWEIICYKNQRLLGRKRKYHK